MMYRVMSIATVIAATSGCGVVQGPDDLTIEDVGIHITSPTEGAAVSGTVMVVAGTSSTNDIVASVEFGLPDGTTVVDTSPPFSTPWSTTTVPDGEGYVIRAIATGLQGETATSNVAVAVANANASCAGSTFSASDLPIGIPDDGRGGIASRIMVNGAGSVTSLALSLSITHPFPEDLVVRLVSPEGEKVGVSDPRDPRIRFNNRTTSAFNGQAAAGVWRLDIEDIRPADTGRLTAWSLTIGASCQPSGQ